MTLGWCLLGLCVVGLLIPAGMVTFARLADPAGLGWVLLQALTPLVVVPYGLALLLLGGAWFGSHGAWRVAVSAVALTVVAALALHLSWAGGSFLGPAPAAAGGPSFRVMSVNLHLGQAEVGTVLRTAARERVDVLVLEEVTQPALARMEADGLRARFRYSAGAPASGRNGVMVFSAHPLRRAATIATSTPGYAVDVDLAGRPVRLLAVHPISPNNGLRRWAADLDLVRRTADHGTGPTLVVGDFNATLDHRPLRRLADSGFRDAAAQAGSGWQPTWPASGLVAPFGIRLPALVQLDHVFLGDRLRADWTRTVTVPGTDHRGLVVQVSL